MSSSPSVLWLIALTGAVFAGLLFPLIDNRASGRKRDHNTLLLLNECLAQHRNSYLIFFIGLGISATSFSHYWIKPALMPAIIGAFGCYFIGAMVTAEHEQRLSALHNCSVPACARPISFGIAIRLLWPNLLTTCILLAFSIYVCLEAETPPGP